jgi:hypothetical protein
MYMECSSAPPNAAHVRVTGIGDTYGTDEKRCDRPPTCPAGTVMHQTQLPNLCPHWECGAPCTASSCASAETCATNGQCYAIQCTQGFTCAADEICGTRGPDALHGCHPRCPPDGYCVKNEPVP